LPATNIESTWREVSKKELFSYRPLPSNLISSPGLAANIAGNQNSSISKKKMCHFKRLFGGDF
jgi:hypothetical protein